MKLFELFKRKPKKEETTQFVLIPEEEDTTPIDLSANVDTSNHICGLYFMYTMSIIDGREIYAVKIGKSNDIGKRMYTYRTHTPFAILGGICEVHHSLLSRYEDICHIRIHQYALPNAYCSGEWEIVSKEDYNMLCSRCNTNVGFRKMVNEWVAC